ncbi:MAG TPA: MG2 domain-containing protein, partial [Stellaceae bacterium]|nr:MG2 domain-containing protein [Stellaceae bacterium]
ALPEALFRNPGLNENDIERFDYSTLVTHWVVSTDIGLTALSGADGLHIVVRSLSTAEPLTGIKLELLSAGEDRLGEALSDANGQVQFAAGLTRGRNAARPGTILAYGQAGDFAVLDLNRAAVDLSDRGDDGRKAVSGPEAFLYTDRGIYRPGETIETMALLRDSLGVSLDNQPLTLVLRRPDGVEVKRFNLAPQTQGGFHQGVTLSRTAPFGNWTIVAFIDPAGEPVGRVAFTVQDFVPETLKVGLTSDAAFVVPGEKIAASLEGQYLYGAPAAGLTGDGEIFYEPDSDPIPAAKGYSFGLVDDKYDNAVEKIEIEAADEKGHVSLSPVLKPLAPTSLPLKVTVRAGLFDPSGRYVSDKIELPVRRQKLLIGLKPLFTDERVEEGTKAGFELRAFDETGKAVAADKIHWSLVRENRVYDWVATEGQPRWHYHIVDDTVGSGVVAVTDAAAAELSQPVEWGSYRLVVNDPDTGAATSLRFYAGWARSDDAGKTPDQAQIAADKPLYAAGDMVRLHLTAPFAGKAQLTLANDRVFETRAIELPKEGTTIEVKASAEWGNGAYALLEAYRPLKSGRARDPVRAVGLAWIGLDPSPRTLTVTLDAPDHVTPRQKVEIPVKIEGAKAGEPTQLTLAAVDE